MFLGFDVSGVVNGTPWTDLYYRPACWPPSLSPLWPPCSSHGPTYGSRWPAYLTAHSNGHCVCKKKTNNVSGLSWLTHDGKIGRRKCVTTEMRHLLLSIGGKFEARKCGRGNISGGNVSFVKVKNVKYVRIVHLTNYIYALLLRYLFPFSQLHSSLFVYSDNKSNCYIYLRKKYWSVWIQYSNILSLIWIFDSIKRGSEI